jgi:hypothetical protein
MKNLKNLQIVQENARADRWMDLSKKSRRETWKGIIEIEFEKEGEQEVAPVIEIVDKLPLLPVE